MMALKAADWWPPFPVIQWVPGLTFRRFDRLLWLHLSLEKWRAMMEPESPCSHLGAAAIMPFKWPKIIRSCGGSCQRCGQFLAKLCCYSWTVMLMREVEPSTVVFRSEDSTVCEKQKAPKHWSRRGFKRKTREFQQRPHGKAPSSQHQSPFHLPSRKRDKCGILL